MVDAILGPLLGKLQELAVDEARAMVAVNADIRGLRDRLMWLQAFLREAEPRRRVMSGEIMRVWLHQTRDAAFDAEDAVEQYSLRVDLSRYPSWTRTILMFFAGITTQALVRHNLSSKIASINSRLEEIIKNKDKYKIEHMTSIVQVPWRPSTSISNASKNLDNIQCPPLVKRKEMRTKLYDALLERKDHLLVITVVGTSGLGKTTLVRELFKQLVKKRDYFNVHAMESFAPYLRATNIMQLILKQLIEDDIRYRRNEVGGKLKELLRDKSYLLVIDGEISSTEWKNFLTALPDDNKASRVVRITQEKPPEAEHHVIEVAPLNEKATKELFLNRVRLEEKDSKYNNEEKWNTHHKDIYDITKGLPLSIVLLSGLLRTKEFPQESEEVIKHLKTKQSNWLDNILSICFDDLPHDLKSCFLYFAALPANAMIEARDLVCMWMAEGFLIGKEGMTMEKLGYLYLNELVARNLVNIGQLNDFSPEGSKLVAIQNKVHDFLKIEAHEASFVEVYGGDDIPAFKTARRLSLPNYIDKYAALASPLPKLRSILSHLEQEVTAEEAAAPELTGDPPCVCYSWHKTNSKVHVESYIRTLLKGSEFLRVIKLSGLEIGEKLPSEIGNVVHLGYLGVTSCSLREIPSSIGKLTCLQTLDVRGTEVQKLPEAFWRIRTLRHVFGSRLILPRRVGDLKNLQTLETIEPDSGDGWDGKTLARMIRLRSLFIRKISSRNDKAFSDAVQKLELLDVLTLKGESIPSIVFKTTALNRLKFMNLAGKLEKHSLAQTKDITSCLSNLKMLSLKRTHVQQDFIDNLAKLPFVAVLALHPDSYDDEQLLFSPGGFRSLKKLKINVEVLKRVEIKALALTNLEDVEIYVYRKDLKVEIPDKPDIVKKIYQIDEEAEEL